MRPESRIMVWQQVAVKDSTSENVALDSDFDTFLFTACKVVKDQIDTMV